MITQGFPLWAVAPDGTAYAVVGWSETESIRYAVLVPLESAYVRGAAGEESNDGAYRYTTTDPRIGADANKIAYGLADLRQRMTALADVLESHGYHDSARSIRQELDK